MGESCHTIGHPGDEYVSCAAVVSAPIRYPYHFEGNVFEGHFNEVVDGFHSNMNGLLFLFELLDNCFIHGSRMTAE